MTFDGCATAVQIIWDWGWVSHCSLCFIYIENSVLTPQPNTDMEIHYSQERRRWLPSVAGRQEVYHQPY